MYIRRKVFSVGLDENGEQKLFSTTDIISEKLYSEEAEKAENKAKSDKNKARVAGVASLGLGAGATALGAKSIGAMEKATKIAKDYDLNRLDRAKRIAAKTGATKVPFGDVVMGDPKKVNNAIALSKRHRRIVDNAIKKQAKTAGKYGAAGLALGAASLATAGYGLKKRSDAKKAATEANDKEKKFAEKYGK